MGVQGDAARCPKRRNTLEGMLSPVASLVFLPSMSHDRPMMTRNAKMDACAKYGEDKFGDGVCACSTTARTREGDQAREKNS